LLYICTVIFNKKNMKKVLLTAVAAFSFLVANAQSNQKGTIHVNVVGGFSVGSGSAESSVEGSESVKFTTPGVAFGVKGQYGLSEKFSAGIGLELGTYVFTPSESDLSGIGGSFDLTLSTFKVDLSGRYYIVNKDKFNFYAGPSVGFISGKNTVSVSAFGESAEDTSPSFSGLNYGINTGINFFFTDVVGGIVQIGYDANNLSAKVEEITNKQNFGGVQIMAGLALKF
jgi:hypothetical protein